MNPQSYAGRQQGVHRRSVTLLRRAAQQVGRVGPQVLGRRHGLCVRAPPATRDNTVRGGRTKKRDTRKFGREERKSSLKTGLALLDVTLIPWKKTRRDTNVQYATGASTPRRRRNRTRRSCTPRRPGPWTPRPRRNSPPRFTGRVLTLLLLYYYQA